MSTTTITNKFKGTCECGTAVAAGAGKAIKTGSGWKVVCPAHTPAAPASKPRYNGGGYTTYRTTEGGTVTYSDDTDDAYDAMKDGFIY
jgi:hypothetical protein